MLSVEEAAKTVSERIQRLPVERIALSATRAAASSPRTSSRRAFLPSFDNSAMDGYAARSRRAARHAAGRRPRSRRARCSTDDDARARRDPHPDRRADARRPRHRRDPGGREGRRQRTSRCPPSPVGDNMRRAGEDIAAGDIAVRAGERLGAGELGLLAALGVARGAGRARAARRADRDRRRARRRRRRRRARARSSTRRRTRSRALIPGCGGVADLHRHREGRSDHDGRADRDARWITTS